MGSRTCLSSISPVVWAGLFLALGLEGKQPFPKSSWCPLLLGVCSEEESGACGVCPPAKVTVRKYVIAPKALSCISDYFILISSLILGVGEFSGTI